MKKINVIILSVIVVLSIISVSFLSYGNNKIKELKEKCNAKIGSVIIISDDTLTIMDYSLIEENFTLSNGEKISMSYVIK